MSAKLLASAVALVVWPPATTDRSAAGNIPATPSAATAVMETAKRNSTSVTPTPEPIERGETGVYDVEFELPEGRELDDYDLAGLNFKWEVDFGGQRVLSGLTFERVYGATAHDPHVSFGFGYFHAD